jgi:hypothetical protein
MSPEDGPLPITGMWEYVILHGEMDFADVIKLRILKWRDYPEIFSWVQCNYQSSYMGKRKPET